MNQSEKEFGPRREPQILERSKFGRIEFRRSRQMEVGNAAADFAHQLVRVIDMHVHVLARTLVDMPQRAKMESEFYSLGNCIRQPRN